MNAAATGQILGGMANGATDIWDVVEVMVKTLVFGAVVALFINWAPWHRALAAYDAWREAHPSDKEKIEQLDAVSSVLSDRIKQLEAQLATCRNSHVTINYR